MITMRLIVEEFSRVSVITIFATNLVLSQFLGLAEKLNFW
jgi:hypothetical protein